MAVEELTATELKVIENRQRRLAKRQGKKLRKSRRRDQRALDYGTYWLISLDNNNVEVGGDNGTTIDKIRAALGDVS